MALDSRIEFDTARNPCVSEGEIARLNYIVDVEKLSFKILVVKAPKTSSELGKKGCADMLVFKYKCCVFSFLKISVIAVLRKIGKQGIYLALAKVYLKLRIMINLILCPLRPIQRKNMVKQIFFNVAYF